MHLAKISPNLDRQPNSLQISQNKCSCSRALSLSTALDALAILGHLRWPWTSLCGKLDLIPVDGFSVSAFALPFIKSSNVSVTNGTRFVTGFQFLDGKTIICITYEKMQYIQLTSNYLPCSRLQQTPWQTTRHSSFYFMGNKEKYSNAMRRVWWCPYCQPMPRFSPSSNWNRKRFYHPNSKI